MQISIFRVKLENRRKMDELWQIPFLRLSKPDEKTKHGHSPRSMISSLSSSSTKLTGGAAHAKDTQHFEFYYFNNELIAAKKHISRPKLIESDNIVFRKVGITEICLSTVI